MSSDAEKIRYWIQYFGRRVPSRRHPYMPATGTEGRCELCGHDDDSALHREPYEQATDEELRRAAL